MNTKTKLPEHVVSLAKSFMDGDESSREPLHDALCECGYGRLAHNHLFRTCCKSGNEKDNVYCSLIYDLVHYGELDRFDSDMEIHKVSNKVSPKS